MLKLLKGLGTKTIVAIISMVIITLWMSTAFFYNTSKKVEAVNTTLTNSNIQLESNLDSLNKSILITDKVVSDFVEKSNEIKTTTEKLRKESIHEYIKQVEPKRSTVHEPGDSSNGSERVTQLALSMHKNYCRARSNDPVCDTNTSIK